MSLLINLRGTNGAGKSYLVYSLLRELGGVPVHRDGKIIAYRCGRGSGNPLYVLGRYTIPTGGCDVFRSVPEIFDLVSEFAKKGDVVFESQILGTLVKPFLELREALSTHRLILALIDTPLETCIEQTVARRREAGNSSPFDPTKTLIPKHRANLRSWIILKKSGLDARILPYQDPLSRLLSWLGNPPLVKRFPRTRRFKPQHIILSIQGTNGSGKSWIVHQLLRQYKHAKMIDATQSIPLTRLLRRKDSKLRGCYGYHLPFDSMPMFVVGMYETPSHCGLDSLGGSHRRGAYDTIFQDIIQPLAEKGYVIFEGMATLGIDRFIKLRDAGFHLIVGVLDTPSEICIQRVRQRRKEKEARGFRYSKPFDPVHLLHKAQSLKSLWVRLAQQGIDVRTLPHKDPLPVVLDWLGLKHLKRYPRSLR